MSPRAESIRVMHPLFQEGQGGSIPTSALSLFVEPINFTRAKELNRLWHSKLPGIGTGFVKNQPFLCYAATFEGLAYAVAVWAHPVARMLPQHEWLQLRRLAIAPDAPKNTASRMLRIMALLIRKARPWVTTLVTYHDVDVHTGAIYKAAGWEKTACYDGGNWNVPSRPNSNCEQQAPKQRWEKVLEKGQQP